MSLWKYAKKCINTAGALMLVMILAGCKGTGEKTAEANRLIEQLDYRGALEVLEEAEEDGENLRLVLRSRGIAYMGLADYEQAAEAFRGSLSGSDGLLQDLDFDTNYYLAAAYTKSGLYSEAEDTYNAILDLRPGEEDVYFLRGNVRMNLGNHEGAKEDFEKALHMKPKDYDRLIAIYEVLDYFGYGEEGQAYLRAALEAGDKQMSKYSIGRIYYYLGEYQKATLALEEARDEGGVESYLYLGRAYEATGDYNYAASVYNSYLAKYEGNAEVYNQLGLCQTQLGDYQKALAAFQAGMQLEESSMLQTLAFNEIVAYEYLGQFEQAYVLITDYLKNYPDDEQAKREYDFLSTR
ncbi:MAG: tetratricopeptide repeat protein [Acetatifactor sp.]